MSQSDTKTLSKTLGHLFLRRSKINYGCLGDYESMSQ